LVGDLIYRERQAEMGKLDATFPRVSATAPDISEHPDRESVITEKPWTSSIVMVSVGGLALFSDGYNAQVVGYMNPVLTELYPKDYTSAMKTRMSNSFLIGEIFGMLFFGWAIDKLGRRNGVVLATAFLVLGVVLTTAAHGATNTGMFWMMIIGRGIAGFGAGGLLQSLPKVSSDLHC
jgi:MFS family permease